MNLVAAIRKSRLRTLAVVLAVAGSALGATVAQPAAANAAEFHSGVGCMESPTPVYSHTCLSNELPAAYFESTVSTNYFICLEAPNHGVTCSREGFAEASRLYYTPITAGEVGIYTVTWWVGEFQAGYWRFQVEPAGGSTTGSSPVDGSSLTPGAGMPSAGGAGAPGLELGIAPTTLEMGGAPSGSPKLGAAPTIAAPACQAADKQVVKLMGDLKHASKKQAHGIESKLKAAKAKAKKVC
jgi:hypothetical protein